MSFFQRICRQKKCVLGTRFKTTSLYFWSGKNCECLSYLLNNTLSRSWKGFKTFLESGVSERWGKIAMFFLGAPFLEGSFNRNVPRKLYFVLRKANIIREIHQYFIHRYFFSLNWKYYIQNIQKQNILIENENFSLTVNQERKMNMKKLSSRKKKGKVLLSSLRIFKSRKKKGNLWVCV